MVDSAVKRVFHGSATDPRTHPLMLSRLAVSPIRYQASGPVPTASNTK